MSCDDDNVVIWPLVPVVRAVDPATVERVPDERVLVLMALIDKWKARVERGEVYNLAIAADIREYGAEIDFNEEIPISSDFAHAVDRLHYRLNKVIDSLEGDGG